jgi:membrane-bound serine protease (ClpP class)
VLILGAVILIVGLLLLVVEGHVSSAGVVGGFGAVGVAAGVGLLIRGAGGRAWVAIPAGVVVVMLGIAVVALGARKVSVALRSRVRSGPDALVGAPATVRSWAGQHGQVSAAGALWTARLAPGWGREGAAPAAGETVIIEHLQGLTLSVRPRETWELESS